MSGAPRAFRLAWRLSRWSATRFTPAGRVVAAAALAAGVLSVDTTRTVAFEVFALALALLACAWLPTLRWRPGLRIERLLPEWAAVGMPLHYRIRLPGGGAGDADWQVRDELEEAFADRAAVRRSREDLGGNLFDRRVGYPRWVALSELLRGGRAEPAPVVPARGAGAREAVVTLTPLRRGVIRFARTRVLRPDVLGLMHAVATCPSPQSLLVLPARHPVPRIAPATGRRHRVGGAQPVPAVGESQEFLQLRDYRAGDPPRRIHWPSSARAGRLVVRETGEEYFARLALVVDSFAGPDDDLAFEAVVSAAASLAQGLELGDTLLDLMFVEDRAVVVTAGRDGGRRAGLLRELALLAPAPGRSFDVLGDAVLARAEEVSACIHVLLAWDAQRARLVERLHARGIAQLVLVTGPVPGATTVQGVPLHRLDVDDLAASLAGMPGRCA